MSFRSSVTWGGLSLAFLVFAEVLPSSSAFGAEAPLRIGPRPLGPPAETPIVPLARAIQLSSAGHHLALPALPPEAVAELKQLDRAANQAKGRLQIGLGRPFAPPFVASSQTLSASEWAVAANGWRVWSAAISSPGALALRIHLQSLKLPAGARLLVYSSSNPASRPAVITPESLAGEQEVWSGMVFSDNVVLEAQAPPAVDPSALAFTISGVSHIYQLPSVRKRLKVGGCDLDVACYPEWAIDAAGTALVSFIDGDQAFVCTGCLLSSGFVTNSIDFFLTAHHCIDNQKIAGTTEFVWLYQNTNCNANPPVDVLSVPVTTGGANLLATSGRSDFAFLRLRQPSPPGVAYLGWTTAKPSTSETVAAIQHPGGDFKRISLGHVLAASANFWGVRWFAGVTEPGSSGSPLCNENHQVLGQLYGGDSSCSDPAGIDDFGRFDVTFKTISRWINPVKGTFTGLFAPTNGPAPQSSGAFTLTATSRGTFSGTLQLGSARYPMRGQFDSGGALQVPLKGGRILPPSVLSLQLDLTNDTGHIDGMLSNSTWTAQVHGNLTFFDAKTLPAPQLGKYTLIIPGNGASATTPGGDSYATVTVDQSGKVRLAGILADGTKFTQSATLSRFGDWPLYVPLYAGQGLVWSWMTFTNSSAGNLSGDLTWIKTNAPKAKLYPAGFTLETNAWGSAFQTGGSLSLSSGNFVLSGGELVQDLTNAVTISGAKGSGDKINLSFNLSSGLFNGRFSGASVPKPVPFNGVVLQCSNFARGFFSGSSTSGRASLDPAP